ncbi:MAG: NfeD family protein [Gammaproteobacteria bacterium]|nr:NfeD family protein [Gammaproteobacteria bacterium]
MFENISPILVWFLLGLLLLLTELVTPNFIMVFFGIGAWVVSLLGLMGFVPNLDAQLAIFISVSILSLVLFRKTAKRICHPRVLLREDDTHEIDTVIGSNAVVLEDIEAHAFGKVELFGTAWKATASDTIKKGSIVKVISHNNLTLKVKLP